MSIFDRLFSGKTDIQVVHAQAAIGDAFAEWSQSEVGRYLIGRIEQAERDALQALAIVDPTKTSDIRQLQERAAAMASLVVWIEQIINEGEAAKFQLDEIASQESGY